MKITGIAGNASKMVDTPVLKKEIKQKKKKFINWRGENLMTKFQVKFTHTTSGWDSGEQGRKYLIPGEFYDIDYIDIHSMHTRIYLKGYSEKI